MSLYQRSLAFTVVILTCSLLGVGQSRALQFQGLGQLPANETEPMATGISADGTSVVGRADMTVTAGIGRSEAFRWTAGQAMIGLDDSASAQYSDAGAVSFDGWVAAGIYETGDGTLSAYYRTHEQGAAILNESPAYGFGLQTGIFESGSVIGGYGLDPVRYRQAWRPDTLAVPIPNNLWLIVTGVIGIAALRLKRKSGNRAE